MKDLLVQKERAMRREADATIELSDMVSHMAGYLDDKGQGPKDGSLKGIMLTVNGRIKAQFGVPIKEMDPATLDTVALLKRDLARLINKMMADKADYPEMKRKMWDLIKRAESEHFHKWSV